MPIEFSSGSWKKIKQTYGLWWEDKLDRPIIPVVLLKNDAIKTQPKAPLLTQETCTDFRWSPEELIERIDYELSKKIFIGDAYPYFNMDCFGPGIAAAFLGARLDNSSGRVWFWPPAEKPIQEIHLEYDPENIWLKRIKDIYSAAMEKWQGQVLMGMTDLGGTLDIVATFATTEKLLLELIDHPDEVDRVNWEVHELWHRFYNEINEILQPKNPGYSDWSGIYSDRPSYMLQCDFSYMISKQMFTKLVKPEIKKTCVLLDRSFYHLDGVGQIQHLEPLLSIPELNGIQWIPGDGKPDSSHWPELFQKIAASGKKIQIVNGGFQAIDSVIKQTNAPGKITYTRMETSSQAEKEIRAKLAQYGID
jgi:hypothetical protein